MTKRTATRKERYEKKRDAAKSFPISLGCVNFMHDGNLGYLIRAAACFGVSDIHVIGSVPDRKTLNPLSGSLYDYVKIIQHSSPSSFIFYTKERKTQIVAAEICKNSQSIHTYKFNFDRPTCLVVGHEECGVPIEILQKSDVINIPMPGVGYCLNTSQAANILLYETIKQYHCSQ